VAEVTSSFDIASPVCYLRSADIPCPTPVVFELLALFQVVKTDRKQKLAVGGAI
jgi:hypothetical protein